MRVPIGVLVSALLLSSMGFSALALEPLTVEERVKAQESIERVFYEHRIWPEVNPGPKPAFEAMMPEAVLRARAENSLRMTVALQERYGVTITAADLQAEMDRMARETQAPNMLRELFAALDNDPHRIAECLARPLLNERLRSLYAEKDGKDGKRPKDFGAWWEAVRGQYPPIINEPAAAYKLPPITFASPVYESWTATPTLNAPDRRYLHTAVWTGTEMIVWAGKNSSGDKLNTGGRYTPATHAWTATSTGPGWPLGTANHTVVWTGTEMIAYGGDISTRARYNPGTDTWQQTCSDTAPPCNRPPMEEGQTAVWSGSRMIVWGGPFVAVGGAYNPATDTWTPTACGADCPSARVGHSAVWDPNFGGGAMMIFGGTTDGGGCLNDGGYYVLSSGVWFPLPATGRPSARTDHKAVYSLQPPTSVIWGGVNASLNELDSGGQCDGTGWTTMAESTYVAGSGPRAVATTGDYTDMLVWGGIPQSCPFPDSGQIYRVSTNTWDPMTTSGAPAGRQDHSAVWAGSVMIVWGGYGLNTCGGPLGTGGIYRYCNSAPTNPTIGGFAAADLAACSDTGVRLTWSRDVGIWGDGGPNDRAYEILRDGAVIQTVAYGTTSYTDTTGTQGQSYTYAVRYKNSCGLSSTTDSMAAADYPVNPVISTNNTAADLAGCADTGVQITWPQDPTDWGDGGTGTRNYMVYRDSTFIGSVLPYPSTVYTDTTGNNAQMYLYRVRYINGCGASYYTFTAGASVEDNIGGGPTGLTNNTAADLDPCADTGVRITWAQDPTDWHDSGVGTRTYDVLRAGSPIASDIAYGTTAYTDTTGVNGTTYAYRVRYNNGCGVNAQTAGVSAADNVQAAPSGLTNNAAADLSTCADTGVQITWAADPASWGDSGSGTRTYDVLRGGTPIATGIAYNTTSHTDTTGVNGTSYSYAVRYNNGCGLNAPTAGVSAADNVQAVPSGLTNNAAADLSTCADTGVQITWAADPASWGDSGSGTRTYDVLRGGTPIATGIAYNTASFTDTTGVNGTNYAYTVRYNNGCGLSAVTSGVSARDLASSVPSSLSNNTAADLSICDDTGVQITWAADPGAWGDNSIGARTYTVLREGAPIASGLAYGTTTFTDTTGADGTPYSYTVRYINGCGLDAVTTGATAADIVDPTMLVDAAYTPATPGWGVDHFASIQSGIDAACAGAEVTVAAGTYAESVNLNKACTVTQSGRVIIAGSLTLSAGTWTSTASVLTLTGNFANNGGTFEANGGTVLLGGTADHTLGGSASTTFSSLFLNDSLQGYWRLDDGSGTSAADGSGNGLNGALNGPAWSGTVAPVLFMDTASLSFDGGNDGVIAPLATPAVDNFSLSIWARWSGGLGASQEIFHNGAAGTNGYGIYLESANGYKICVRRSGVGPLYTTSVLPNDGATWKNLVLVRRSGTFELYMNGALLPFTFGDPALAPVVPTTGTYIGNNAALTLPFNGLLDDARIYSRALSAPEITALGTGHIPQGYASVTTLEHALDLDGTLRLNSGRLDAGPGNHPVTVGKNWAHWGGDFLPRGGTVTLDGSSAQAVIGEPVFNHFVVGPGAAATLPAGTMTVGGDFTNHGTVDANGGTLSFNAPWTQTLTGGTAFANIIVGSASTLATADDVTVGGTLTNNGWTQETKAISTTGSRSFGLAAVTVNTTTQGTLSSLQIRRRDQNHFSATPNEQTGRYWTIAPTGSGYAADLTLPQDDVSGDPRACRYSAGIWDCVATGHTSTTVTRAGVTAFSDWAVGKGDTVLPPAPVGDGRSSTTPALFVKQSPSSALIDVTYDAMHCPGQKAIILYGTLGSYDGYSGCAQSDAGMDGSADIDTSLLPESVWFNIVWTSDNIAGHPGFAFNGATDVERTWNVAPYCGVFIDSHGHDTCP